MQPTTFITLSKISYCAPCQWKCVHVVPAELLPLMQNVGEPGQLRGEQLTLLNPQHRIDRMLCVLKNIHSCPSGQPQLLRAKLPLWSHVIGSWGCRACSCWALIASLFLSCDKQDVLLSPVGGLVLAPARECRGLFASGMDLWLWEMVIIWEWLWEMMFIWGNVASWAAEILKKFQAFCSWDFLSLVMDYFSCPIGACVWVCSHCGAISWGTACFQQENVACHFRVWMEACANRKAPLWPQDEPSAPQGCGAARVCAGWAQPQCCASTTLAWGCASQEQAHRRSYQVHVFAPKSVCSCSWAGEQTWQFVHLKDDAIQSGKADPEHCIQLACPSPASRLCLLTISDTAVMGSNLWDSSQTGKFISSHQKCLHSCCVLRSIHLCTL